MSNMKTPEQIKEWLQEQSYYETLKNNIVKSAIMDGHSIRMILGGERGEKTMRDAVLFLDPSKYDWDKIERDFKEWYNQN